jgi:integrase
MSKWLKTKYSGVRYREHETRRIINSPMKDRYYAIYYRLGSKVKWEGIGWLSQGVTVESAVAALAEVKKNIKLGDEIITLKEKRQHAVRTFEKKAAQNVTIAEFWSEKYRPRIFTTLSDKAFRSVDLYFKKWILSNFGSIKVCEFDNKHWEQLLAMLVEANRTPRTREYIAGELRRLLTYARDIGYNVNKIPTARQSGFVPAKNNRRRRVITPSEAQSILTELKQRNTNAYYITVFAFLTGCRFSEAACLKWVDVDFDNKALLFAKTKNGTSRKILITSKLELLLREVKSVFTETNFVFHNSFGKRYFRPPQAFGRVVEGFNMNVGRDQLDRISFHSIRHTVATKLASVLDLRSLMDHMGWKRVEMAARYMHSDEKKIMKATETLSELFEIEKSDESEGEIVGSA